MIQRPSRYVTNRYHNTSSVETMLQKLQWPTLEERRKKARLTLLYKVANGEVKIDAGNKLLPPDRLSRHNNAQSFQIPSCKTSIRKESLYPKTIRDWNNLPAQVTAAETGIQNKISKSLIADYCSFIMFI